MEDWLDRSRERRESFTPAVRFAIALSILVHLAAMWRLPSVPLPAPELAERNDRRESIAVYLTPPPPPAPRTKPPPTLRAQPKTAPRPPPAPPPAAREQPRPSAPSPPPSPPAVAAPSPGIPPAEQDLSSYIDARRRARSESAPPAPPRPAAKAPPAEDEKSRADRIVASNLAPEHTMTFGYDPTRRGGVFHVEHMSDDAAEFIFYGWHKAMRRNMAQLIEVRKGSNPDIRIAIIRRMIAIIREYEQDDFVWESQRLGRNVTLSARARDNAGLEDFLMTEFFGEQRGAR
jgi:outer membrane biosynthesis protein TonB